MSINRMDKEDVVYLHSLHSGILFTHKKEWDKGICHDVDGPRNYPP